VPGTLSPGAGLSSNLWPESGVAPGLLISNRGSMKQTRKILGFRSRKTPAVDARLFFVGITGVGHSWGLPPPGPRIVVVTRPFLIGISIFVPTELECAKIGRKKRGYEHVCSNLLHELRFPAGVLVVRSQIESRAIGFQLQQGPVNPDPKFDFETRTGFSALGLGFPFRGSRFFFPPADGRMVISAGPCRPLWFPKKKGSIHITTLRPMFFALSTNHIPFRAY